MSHLVVKLLLLNHRIQRFWIIIVSFWWKVLVIDFLNSEPKRWFFIKFKADETFDFEEELKIEFYKAVSSNMGSKICNERFSKTASNSPRFWSPKRVYSGMNAILDFQIVNLRSYDCSKESKTTNCQIVELFLTVDTSRKMQNGVNIHVSIDRFDDFIFPLQKFILTSWFMAYHL